MNTTAPAFLPAATHSYLERAAESLREAITSTSVPERYAHAHVAALRATAALLAARAQPTAPPRRRRQKNAWVLLAEIAPELSEWAAFFAAGAAKRAAAESGSRRAVTEREAGSRLDRDVFVATVGGARLSDPATDLAVCLAVASAATGIPMPPDGAVIGEVALSGDIRPVGQLAQRVAEAARIGYRRVLVPPGSLGRLPSLPPGVAVVELAHLSRALESLSARRSH